MYSRGRRAENVHQSANKRLDFLSNLLTWARSQTESIRCKPEPLNLKRLAAGTIDLLGDTAGQKTATLENQIPEGTEVKADRVMLELILRNLISNGIKFTPDKGHVRIGARETPKETTIFIQDSGIGIAAEALTGGWFRMTGS